MDLFLDGVYFIGLFFILTVVICVYTNYFYSPNDDLYKEEKKDTVEKIVSEELPKINENLKEILFELKKPKVTYEKGNI
jgi:hypothetical protein